ncbi:uncharacterized protein [Ptychodera flava]|uniref:uncharacterized protein n=1 Tax=Ptychodera flava TaxID=63121 RepID=UPI00396A2D97
MAMHIHYGDSAILEITLDVQSSVSRTTSPYNKQTVVVDSSDSSLTTTRKRDDSNLANQEPHAETSQQERYSSSAEQEKVMSSYVITIPFMIAMLMIFDSG